MWLSLNTTSWGRALLAVHNTSPDEGKPYSDSVFYMYVFLLWGEKLSTLTETYCRPAVLRWIDSILSLSLEHYKKYLKAATLYSKSWISVLRLWGIFVLQYVRRSEIELYIILEQTELEYFVPEGGGILLVCFRMFIEHEIFCVAFSTSECHPQAISLYLKIAGHFFWRLL